MSQREKLIAKICARPVEANFEDVRSLLEFFGWEQNRQKGSHVSFTRPGYPTFTVPTTRGRRVKRVYLNRLCELLGLDED